MLPATPEQVRVGDEIIEVEGHPVAGKKPSECNALIRGQMARILVLHTFVQSYVLTARKACVAIRHGVNLLSIIKNGSTCMTCWDSLCSFVDALLPFFVCGINTRVYLSCLSIEILSSKYAKSHHAKCPFISGQC